MSLHKSLAFDIARLRRLSNQFLDQVSDDAPEETNDQFSLPLLQASHDLMLAQWCLPPDEEAVQRAYNSANRTAHDVRDRLTIQAAHTFLRRKEKAEHAMGGDLWALDRAAQSHKLSYHELVRYAEMIANRLKTAKDFHIDAPLTYRTLFEELFPNQPANKTVVHRLAQLSLIRRTASTILQSQDKTSETVEEIRQNRAHLKQAFDKQSREMERFRNENEHLNKQMQLLNHNQGQGTKLAVWVGIVGIAATILTFFVGAYFGPDLKTAIHGSSRAEAQESQQ